MVGSNYYVHQLIKSYSKGNIYANIGDVVKCITADHINVWIVEDKKGDRFPVNPEKLSTDPPIIIEPKPIIEFNLFNQPI